MTVRILTGDCRDVLRTLPDESVHCVVTSPPYLGLRNYGVDGQIGLEETPQAYVEQMVAVFGEVRRVLRKDGTCWLNLGDSYNAYNGGAGPSSSLSRGTQTRERPQLASGYGLKFKSLKPKDRLMIPARVALALQDDGWWLRDEIVWHKPNPMPSSVEDRTTPAHEMLYLLSKSARYYYDQESIKEPAVVPTWEDGSRVYSGVNKHGANVQHGERTTGRVADRPQRKRALEIAREKGLTDAHLAAIRAAGVSDTGKAQVTQSGFGKNTEEVMRLAAEAKTALGGYYREFLTSDTGRNKRSVWTLATQPFSEAHFATFPPALIEPCIKAGCPQGGTVLDPFFGAGTTGLVADRLGRNCIGIELNPEYAAMARRRIEGDAGMFASVDTMEAAE